MNSCSRHLRGTGSQSHSAPGTRYGIENPSQPPLSGGPGGVYGLDTDHPWCRSFASTGSRPHERHHVHHSLGPGDWRLQASDRRPTGESGRQPRFHRLPALPIVPADESRENIKQPDLVSNLHRERGSALSGEIGPNSVITQACCGLLRRLHLLLLCSLRLPLVL